MAVTALRSRWFGTNAPPCTSLRFALCQRTRPTSPAAQAWPTPRGTALLGTARQEDQEGKSFARETGNLEALGAGILPAACWRLLSRGLHPLAPVGGQALPPLPSQRHPPPICWPMRKAWAVPGVRLVSWLWRGGRADLVQYRLRFAYMPLRVMKKRRNKFKYRLTVK